jgi:hypothetical protein
VRRICLLAVTIATAATAASAAATAVPPKLAGCVPGSAATVRPKKIIVACGDANFYFTNLKWSSWGPKQAVASGIATVNDCKPYCAAGHFHTYAATITLTRPRSCSDGALVYTRIAWRFPGKAPAALGRHSSQSSPCR